MSILFHFKKSDSQFRLHLSKVHSQDVFKRGLIIQENVFTLTTFCCVIILLFNFLCVGTVWGAYNTAKFAKNTLKESRNKFSSLTLLLTQIEFTQVEICTIQQVVDYFFKFFLLFYLSHSPVTQLFSSFPFSYFPIVAYFDVGIEILTGIKPISFIPLSYKIELLTLANMMREKREIAIKSLFLLWFLVISSFSVSMLRTFKPR